MKMKFYETIEKYDNAKVNLILDMDGVIAEYDIGNFDYETIRPLNSNIEKIRKLSTKPNIDIKILTICKTNQIVLDKIKWIKKHMPFFSIDNVIFISKEEKEYDGLSSKELKSNYLKNNLNDDTINIVVDDDNEIIKYILKNNANVIVFQVSSLID